MSSQAAPKGVGGLVPNGQIRRATSSLLIQPGGDLIFPALGAEAGRSLAIRISNAFPLAMNFSSKLGYDTLANLNSNISAMPSSSQASKASAPLAPAASGAVVSHAFARLRKRCPRNWILAPSSRANSCWRREARCRETPCCRAHQLADGRLQGNR